MSASIAGEIAAIKKAWGMHVIKPGVPAGQPSYWDLLKDNWLKVRVASCTCDFCHGTDICTFQRCWNTVYGAKTPTSGSSATFTVAQTQAQANTVAPAVIHAGGMRCCKCDGLNEYAEPNRADGTYICFECK